MTANLTAARDAGELVAWAEPRVVAGHMWAQYMAAFLHWGVGECDLDGFRTIALSGICHVLLGVTRGRFADEVEVCARSIAPHIAALHPSVRGNQEARHARSAARSD
jgi:hypothetical protein